MATIFTKIMNGEIPSRMIWEDEQCVSFLDVRPLSPGHALVIPRREIDQWTDLTSEEAAHLMKVAHAIGNAQKAVFSAPRIGLMIAGFEVPHAHVHVFAIASMSDFDFAEADANPDQSQLDQHLSGLRSQLTAMGHTEAEG